MEINDPLRISVIDNDKGSRELHLDFTDEFRNMKLEQQSETFHRFLLWLRSEISLLEDSDPNQQGMLTILQVCEQLQTHIDANEIPLDETIVANLEINNPFGDIKLM